MCHPHHLCFTLSVILCIRAAYGFYDEYTLKPRVRDNLKELLEGTKARYKRKLEDRVAEDISLYALNHKLKKPGKLPKLLKFVNDSEMAFCYKTRYFESKQQLFEQIVHVKGKIGCAHLSAHKPYLRGYICLIEEPICSWNF